MARALRRWWASYYRALETHPLTTKCATGFVLLAGGDVTCQAIEHSHATAAAPADTAAAPPPSWHWDHWRTARMASMGAIIVAPCNHFWINMLVKRVRRWPLQVVIDQSVMTPVMVFSCMSWLTMFEHFPNARAGYDATRDKLAQDYASTVWSAYAFWPALQAFNFALVPAPLRVPVLQVGSFCWNTYLSWVCSPVRQQQLDDDKGSSGDDEKDERALSRRNSYR